MTRSFGLPDSDDLNPTTITEMEEVGLTVGDILRSLSKNKWLILACTVMSIVCATAYVATTTPVYEAAATIRIDPSRAGSLGLSDLLSLAGGGGGDQVQTEMAILKSDEVALATLNSLSDGDFRAFSGFDKRLMNFKPSEQPLTFQQEGVLGRFKQGLTTKQADGTQIVTVSIRNSNPQLAAIIANHLVSAYIRQNFDSRFSSVSQATVWLSEQMDQLKDRAANAQKKLAAFQEANNLLGADLSNNTTTDRIKMLNDRLTSAEGDRIIKEAQLRAAEAGDPTVLISLFPDPDLQSLQSQQANLFAQYTQLSSKFGPAYPPLAEIKQQMVKTAAKIQGDIGVILGRLKEDYGASSSVENTLRNEYASEMEKAYALNRKQADYAVLVAEGTSSRELYDTLQYKLQQAVVDAGLNSVNMMIVDRARAPMTPIEPKKTLIVAFGLLLGLSAGVGSALLRESLSDQIQSISQLESASKFATLAAIPHSDVSDGKPDEGKRREIMHLVSLSEPKSRQAESYRSLRNSVLLSSIDKPPKTILVTSSLPGEGKSSTSANYSVVLAQKGAKVLLVDADLRRPTLHRYFGVLNTEGLSDRLMGEDLEMKFLAPVESLPNLHFVPAGMTVAFPSEALGSAKFKSLVEEWETLYDYIILDSAPLLTVSDSLPIASWADTVVLVVRAGMTPMKALLRTKAILARVHANIAGAVLNDTTSINADSGYYGKGGYGYYN